MKTFLQAAVFIFLAIPFIYMFFDVLRELLLQAVAFYKKEARPKLGGVFNLLIK